MKPMSLNLSKMKKIAGDKDSSHFQHDDGHIIIIAHKALPALQRKQIEKLPMSEGGILPAHMNGKEQPESNPKLEQMKVRNPAPAVQKMSDGGQMGAPQQITDDDSDQSNSQQGNQPIDPAVIQMGKDIFKAKGGKIQNYKKGGMVQHFDQGTVNGPVQAQPAPQQQPQSAPPSQPFAYSPIATQPTVQQPNPPVLGNNGLVNGPAAVNQIESGAQERAATEGAEGQAMVPVEAQRIQQMNQLANDYKGKYQEFHDHANTTANAIENGLINPNHYIENMTSGQKVGTAMGLLFGGFASGTAGRSGSPAQDWLNRQIDRDIDAQKARSDQQRTVYGMYKDVFGAGVTANQMTKAAMDDAYAAKARQVAAKFATPAADAAAKMYIGNLMIDKDQNIKGAAWNSMMTTPSGAGAAQQQPGQQGVSAPQGTQEVPSIPYIDSNGKMQGKPGTAQVPASQDQSNAFKPDLILQPGALQAAGALNTQYPGIYEEAKAASQAEKFLNGAKGDGDGGIHDIYQRLYKASGQGQFGAGVGGAAQRSSSGIAGAIGSALGAIEGKSAVATGIGGALGHAVSVPALTKAQKEYELYRQKVKQEMASSLHGVLSVNDIDKFIDPFIPGFMDSPELVAEKESQLRDTIKKSLQTGALQTPGLLANPRR